MLAVSLHRGGSCVPWDHRMRDLPEATTLAKHLLEENLCPRTIIGHLEGYGYSFYVALGALAAAKEAVARRRRSCSPRNLKSDQIRS
jgi:hypothetical protein